MSCNEQNIISMYFLEKPSESLHVILLSKKRRIEKKD